MAVQGATFNMCGQLYYGHTKAMALSSSPVVSAQGSEMDNPGPSPGRGKALCPWDVQAPLLGLAKSILAATLCSNTFLVLFIRYLPCIIYIELQF